MTPTREIVFIDPAVTDIPDFVAGLRPGVSPVLLRGLFPAAEEMARALHGRADLDAIHIVVHGRPGELSFSAGAISGRNIDCYGRELAAIGAALGPCGDLRLWSCYAGEGANGRAFVGALSDVTGTQVAAATGIVGAAAKGGTWDLETISGAAVVSPLTGSGVAAYAGVMSDYIVVDWDIFDSSSLRSEKYYIVLNAGTKSDPLLTIVGSFEVPGGVAGGEVGHFAGQLNVQVSISGTFNVSSGAPPGAGEVALYFAREDAMFLADSGNSVILLEGFIRTISNADEPPADFTIIGTDGADLVDAIHTVAGQPLPTAFDDLIKGKQGKDALSGLEGDDELRGGAANDTLGGGAGDDLVVGGGGSNNLTGGEGDDIFLFTTPQASDKVTDFTDGDIVALSNEAFPGIGPVGVLQAKYFHVGDEGETAKQKVLYDDDSGWLLYAKHGSDTADPVRFAKIGKNLDHFDNGDIIVI